MRLLPLFFTLSLVLSSQLLAAEEFTSMDALLKVMWSSYRLRNFNEAIRIADLGINEWKDQAKEQQDDKQHKVGGLVYNKPWTVKSGSPVFNSVNRWPILNGVSAMEWVLASSYFQLGNEKEAKEHIRTIILNYSLGQIYSAPERTCMSEPVHGLAKKVLICDFMLFGLNAPRPYPPGAYARVSEGVYFPLPIFVKNVAGGFWSPIENLKAPGSKLHKFYLETLKDPDITPPPSDNPN